jgi:hypothetical protein
MSPETPQVVLDVARADQTLSPTRNTLATNHPDGWQASFFKTLMENSNPQKISHNTSAPPDFNQGLSAALEPFKTQFESAKFSISVNLISKVIGLFAQSLKTLTTMS